MVNLSPTNQERKYVKQCLEPTNQIPQVTHLQCMHCSLQSSNAGFYPWHPSSVPSKIVIDKHQAIIVS